MASFPMMSPPLVFVRVMGPRGSRELRAVLSPTSEYCLIGRRDAEDLGYETGPYHRKIAFLPEINKDHALVLATVGGIIEAPIISIVEMNLAEILARDVKTAVYDLPEPIGFDMLLGAPFFGHKSIAFDFSRNNIAIGDVR